MGAMALAPLAPTPALADDLPPTPRMTEGPFYPRSFPKDVDGDLTRVEGRSKAADGTPLDLTGRVLDRSGKPRAGANVEIWQCDALGQYHHVGNAQSDGDPDFQGFGAVETDAEGRYRFKTIKPAAYPAGPNRMRPAHIHFQVSGRQDKIVTQMYFDGDPYNDADPFLGSVGRAERKELLVRKLQDPSPKLEAGSKMVVFDLVLYKG